MATTQAIISAGTTLARQEAFIPKDTGSLLSLCAITDTGAPRAGQVWVEFGIMIAGTGLENRQAILGQGYLGANSPIGWTGKLPLEPTMQIYLFVWSSVAFNVRLGVITENP